MLNHVVLMKFADPADIRHAKELLEGLVGRVEQLRGLTVGLDETRSATSYDLCLVTVFASAEGLQGYQEHPEHLEVAGWLRPRLAGFAAVDYTSGEGLDGA